MALSNPLDRLGSLQVVNTLAQLETIERVQLGQEEFVSADTEEVLPAILVESPPVGATVTSPLTIRGTANTFEATFMLRVQAGGRKLAERFVTATSGSGERGTFDTTIAVPEGAPGRIVLVAFEVSAANGRPTNVVRTPLDLR